MNKIARACLLVSVLSPIFCLFDTSLRAQMNSNLPAPPSNFDSSAKRPPNLPAVIEIPSNTHIEVRVWRKKPFHYQTPPDPNSLEFLMDPDLESAVIDRSARDAHVVFHWEENRTSEAFIVHGFTFRLIDLRFPNQVIISSNPLNFWLNRGEPDGNSPYNFPGLDTYAPGNFVGTASFNGAPVWVFAPDGKKPGDTSYPQSNSVAIEPKALVPLYLDDGVRVFTFSYTPDSKIVINPEGAYLQKIQKQLGHYP